MTIKIEISAHDIEAQRYIGEALQKIADAKRGLVTSVAEHILSNETIEEVEEPVPAPPVTQVEQTMSDPQVEEPVPAPPVTQVEQTMSDPQVEQHTPAPPVTEVEQPVPAPPSYTVTPLYDSKAETVDANGLPWDERIHAGSKTTNQDGTWKARRKPQDMTQEEWDEEQTIVTNELKGLVGDTDDNEPQFTFDGLLVEIGPHFANPDFTARSSMIIEQMGLNNLTDLRTNQSRIGEFRTLMGLKDE